MTFVFSMGGGWIARWVGLAETSKKGFEGYNRDFKALYESVVQKLGLFICIFELHAFKIGLGFGIQVMLDEQYYISLKDMTVSITFLYHIWHHCILRNKGMSLPKLRPEMW